MASLERAEGVFPVPKRPENVLLLRGDDGDRVRDEERRLLLRDASHVAAFHVWRSTGETEAETEA